MSKLVRVGDQRAIQTSDGDIMMLIANKILVHVQGSAEAPAKLSYAQAVDRRQAIEDVARAGRRRVLIDVAKNLVDRPIGRFHSYPLQPLMLIGKAGQFLRLSRRPNHMNAPVLSKLAAGTRFKSRFDIAHSKPVK